MQSENNKILFVVIMIVIFLFFICISKGKEISDRFLGPLVKLEGDELKQSISPTQQFLKKLNKRERFDEKLFRQFDKLKETSPDKSFYSRMSSKINRELYGKDNFNDELEGNRFTTNNKKNEKYATTLVKRGIGNELPKLIQSNKDWLEKNYVKRGNLSLTSMDTVSTMVPYKGLNIGRIYGSDFYETGLPKKSDPIFAQKRDVDLYAPKMFSV